MFLLLEQYVSHRHAAICLCYHNITEGADSSNISAMEAGTDRRDFESQLCVLTKYLNVIDDHSLADWLDGRNVLEADSLLITFDDGYLDNLTIAAPILERYGATGVIYVATQYIDSTDTYWWIRLSNAMRTISPEQWEALAAENNPRELCEIVESENLQTWESRRRARAGVAKVLDELTDKEPILSRIESVCTGCSNGSMPLLSWKQIKEMEQDGISFGGHTHSHPRLSKLPRQEVREEVRKCAEILENRLDQPLCSFAYPSGDYNGEVVEELKTSKFRLAFTTNPGMITQSSSRYELPRIYFSRTNKAQILAALVAFKLAKHFPKLFGRLAQRLG